MRLNSMTLITVATLICASPAFAEFSQVVDQETFVSLVKGKELKRPFVNLEVLPDGEITGRGAAWPVEGNWTWNDGYFCRDLFWGGDALGYNCQEVQVTGNRIRFTSDRGAGDSAEFRLR
ncbi:MAG: dihydrodipicolinate reductase [Roseobacter sp.]